MSNEITTRMSLQIANGSLFEQTTPTAFNDNQNLALGPTPGQLTIAQNHTIINLSQLTTPGWCWMMNIDPTTSVYWGIYNSHFNEFFPVGRLDPGKIALFKLSDLIGRDMNPGTGTSAQDAFVNSLAMKALGAPAQVIVKAYNA